MSLAAPTASPLRHSKPRPAPERRRFKRHALLLLGRFMRANKEEHTCKLNDISVGGASISSTAPVEMGEKILAYFDHIGGIEGTVVRLFDGGFAIELNATLHKREKLAAQITWLINKDEVNGIESRRHQRVKVADKFLTLHLAEDITTECRVIDISLSGAAVETTARPVPGSEIKLGKLPCRVVRHLDNGIALQFLQEQPSSDGVNPASDRSP
jgi:PilZ domain